jgi:phosphonate transport system permease protein
MNATPPPPDDTAHPPLKAPPPIFNARCMVCWLMASVLVLIVASFIALD